MLAPYLSPALRTPYVFGAIRDLNSAAYHRKEGNYAEPISFSSTRARIFRSRRSRMPSASSSSVNGSK